MRRFQAQDSGKGDEAVLEDAAEGAAAPEDEAVGPAGGHLANVGEQPGTVKPVRFPRIVLMSFWYSLVPLLLQLFPL